MTNNPVSVPMQTVESFMGAKLKNLDYRADSMLFIMYLDQLQVIAKNKKGEELYVVNDL